ncbi:hypothetical protein SCLCIDRAFT_486976 [Scleroderma citrinum Foug A]|uniref:Uncharacterized protein n=1 Tax=Scleroderma citrinum Foug A TaxID=1036808 RepID=A0A0C3D9M3_9AGAM|nr:hypothetical protein SCLCIDRAFT_486976 [Scleroderma citrinum Foug A]
MQCPSIIYMHASSSVSPSASRSESWTSRGSTPTVCCIGWCWSNEYGNITGRRTSIEALPSSARPSISLATTTVLSLGALIESVNGVLTSSGLISGCLSPLGSSG